MLKVVKVRWEVTVCSVVQNGAEQQLQMESTEKLEYVLVCMISRERNGERSKEELEALAKKINGRHGRFRDEK